MEDLVTQEGMARMKGLDVDPQFWSGRRVLVTGHTGFKGAWLAFWLTELGAQVTGLALKPNTSPNLFDLLGLAGRVRHHEADINDIPTLEGIFATDRPEIILHLAAQALVGASYEDPVGTIAANVLGVASLLQVARGAPDVRAVVVVTSDKCYDNRGWSWGYRETDRLGGHDPYSASKGAAEIITAAMRDSYFSPGVAGAHPARIATVRAGNVVGGGDWSRDRLVPDMVRGCLGEAGEAVLRNPSSVRPWQHVLEPIAAYMGLAQQLFHGTPGADQAWNFGPADDSARTVRDVADAISTALGRGRVVDAGTPNPFHEATLLRLDCSRVRSVFGWRPAFDFDATIRLTADWYSAWHRGDDVVAATRENIAAHVRASTSGLR